jgi:hypothetical protein
MLSSTFALAPAGVLGSGSAHARPYACAVAVRPSLVPVAVVEGTRVPVAGMARRRGVADLAGFWSGIDTTGLPTPKQHDPINQNDGTTPLGIHPRGRSTS